ncbi:MAG TPA: heme ABC transporter permease CcmC [Gammaproteobacteria bacterium]|nr:heme ABC transporter permease CcmC [Gammaproteobacteria bacterium]
MFKNPIFKKIFSITEALLTRVLSPPYFFSLAATCLPWLVFIFIVSLSYGLIAGLFLAPADYLQGEGFRILYVHVPCAFLSLLVYSFMAGCATLGLIWRFKLAFAMMQQSAPLGALFTFLALFTGSLWGKPMWGTFWIWDARLTSELILLFLYFGVLALHRALPSQRFADQATAVLVLIGFIDIPIIHYSVTWWNTLHQGSTLRLFAPSLIDSSMLYPLIAMTVAFCAYFAIALILRLRCALLIESDSS